MKDIIITTAKNSGFCFGVRRAVKIIEDIIITERNKNSGKKIILLGKPIHNNQYIAELKSKGIILVDDGKTEYFKLLVNEDKLTEFHEEITALAGNDSIIITRAHGTEKKLLRELYKTQNKIVETICSDVEKIYILLKDSTDNDTFAFIIGDSLHPEIEGIKSYSAGQYKIYKNHEELAWDNEYTDKILNTKKAVLISQTTHNIKDYEKCKKFFTDKNSGIKIYDTICNVTQKRQDEAEALAKTSDIMFVIGSTISSNTKKLYEICKNQCEKTFIIETSEQLPLYIFKDYEKHKGAVKVGITAGASTPDSIIKEVERRIMADNIDNSMINSEMSFEEMLNLSFVTLNRGARVKGTISAISGNELHVDLGTKHTGILTLDEITDDSSFKLDEVFKVGDEIETQVIKINDQDGTALLSKKRIDSTDNWDKIVKIYNDGTIIDGKIVQVVNGGLIALADSVKLFVPASQANVSKDTDLQTMINKKVRMKIIDINEQKHRAIASVRNAVNEEKRAGEQKVWTEIEIGKKYTGIVKSIASYGAFVDIGGVDGMVHITELSWNRIKHPSEIVKVGDSVEVYIKDFDAEKKRISLGYKDASDNPWAKFINNHKVDDIVEVKILNNMPFGSFAEIYPGVDGLIHISQIADRKISKPSEVLNIGDIVKVKITEINEKDRRISLSIRALLELATPTEETDKPSEPIEL